MLFGDASTSTSNPSPPSLDDAASGLSQGLGALAKVPTPLVPNILRLRDAMARGAAERAAHKQDGWNIPVTSAEAVAQGVVMWRSAMERGEPPPMDAPWPPSPLKEFAGQALTRSGAQRLAYQHPALMDALLKEVLQMHLTLENQQRNAVASSAAIAFQGTQKSSTAAQGEEAAPEADEETTTSSTEAAAAAASAEKKPAAQPATRTAKQAEAESNLLSMMRKRKPVKKKKKVPVAAAADATAEGTISEQDDDQTAVRLLARAPASCHEHAVAASDRLARRLMSRWGPSLAALESVGRAFDGLEALLGTQEGSSFDPDAAAWQREGFSKLDGYRKQLEECEELRALVRTLGRGAGWGPLRKSPCQVFDEKARLGLLRTVFEQQETRGLCRSDDLSRMLPAEAALLAKGRTNREAKLLFFARLAERNLMSYERDGWSEQPADVPDVYRREIRPTAERGPILLCVDSSGSMRGTREDVAKAIAIECMRQARSQERDCYAFAFAGDDEVAELELNHDPESLATLMGFLERTFNGGTEFNVPLTRCLERLHDAKWANSDILLVTDGELRPPKPEITRKLEGAKESMGLRVHGLALPANQVIGHQAQLEAKLEMRVLRSLSTNTTRRGTDEVNLHLFEGWDAFESDVFAEENAVLAAQVAAGKLAEAWREEEVARRMAESADESAKERALKSVPVNMGKGAYKRGKEAALKSVPVNMGKGAYKRQGDE